MSLQKTREFILKEKLVSFRDKVNVMNTNKEVLGHFIGKLIKIGNKYRLLDQKNQIILVVKEKVVSVRSTYRFYKTNKEDPNDDELIGSLKRKLVSIKPSYWFEDPSEKKVFTMKGNIFALKYKLLKDGKAIAEISKKLFRIKGTYGVKINSSASDDTAMLVLGLVVMLHHEKEEDR